MRRPLLFGRRPRRILPRWRKPVWSVALLVREDLGERVEIRAFWSSYLRSARFFFGSSWSWRPLSWQANHTANQKMQRRKVIWRVDRPRRRVNKTRRTPVGALSHRGRIFFRPASKFTQMSRNGARKRVPTRLQTGCVDGDFDVAIGARGDRHGRSRRKHASSRTDQVAETPERTRGAAGAMAIARSTVSGSRPMVSCWLIRAK